MPSLGPDPISGKDDRVEELQELLQDAQHDFQRLTQKHQRALQQCLEAVRELPPSRSPSKVSQNPPFTPTSSHGPGQIETSPRFNSEQSAQSNTLTIKRANSKAEHDTSVKRTASPANPMFAGLGVSTR